MPRARTRIRHASQLDVGADNVKYIRTRTGRSCRISEKFFSDISYGELGEDPESGFFWAPINAKNEILSPMPTLHEVRMAARAVLDLYKIRWNIKVEKRGINFHIYKTKGTAPFPPGIIRYFEENGIEGAAARRIAFAEMSYNDFIDIALRYGSRRKESRLIPWDDVKTGDSFELPNYTQQQVKRDYEKWKHKTAQTAMIKIMTNGKGGTHVVRVI
jgi:hypothetical protein